MKRFPFLIFSNYLPNCFLCDGHNYDIITLLLVNNYITSRKEAPIPITDNVMKASSRLWPVTRNTVGLLHLDP